MRYPFFIQWHDSGQGFVYKNATEQRLLKSKAEGFIEPDIKKQNANVGLIDWGGVVTWAGAHRYSFQSSAKEFFYKNKKFDLTLLVSGGVCGVAKLENIFIVFTHETDSNLICYFIKNNTVLNSVIVDSYNLLLQCVAVNQDCTKASFIAVPVGQWKLQTVVIELSITINTVDEIYTVSVIDTISQDVENHITVIESPYSVSRSIVSVIVAVDYDSTNTRKTFFIESSYSRIYTATDDLGYPVRTMTDSDRKIGSINYNGQEAGYINFGIDSTLTRTYTSIYEFVDSVEVTLFEHNRKFILINDLDLRHDVFAYTSYADVFDDAENFVNDKTYSLIVGAYSAEFKTAEHNEWTWPDPRLANYEYPVTPQLSYTHYDNSDGFIECIGISFNVFGGYSFAAYGVDYITLTTEQPTSSNQDTLGVSLIDKFGNKFIYLQPVQQIKFFLGTVSFWKESSVMVKIDNTNTTHTTDALLPVGII